MRFAASSFSLIPLSVYVFCESKNVYPLTKATEWHRLEYTPDARMHFRVYISSFMVGMRRFEKPKKSISSLKRECVNLFEKRFIKIKEFDSYLYPTLFNKLRNIGFNDESSVIIQHHDRTYTLYKLARRNIVLAVAACTA